MLLFGKSIKEPSPYCRRIIDIQCFECRKFSFTMNRYSWALVRRPPLAIVAVSFQTFKLFPINIAGTLHSRGSISRVNIGAERPSTLCDVHTRELLIRVDTYAREKMGERKRENRFNSKIRCLNITVEIIPSRSRMIHAGSSDALKENERVS